MRRHLALLSLTCAVALVAPAAASEPWTVLPTTDATGYYLGITAGPDGAMWLTDFQSGLVRVDTSGKRTRVPLTFESDGAGHRFRPVSITTGADGNFYLTGCVDTAYACSVVAIATPAGALSVYQTPSKESPRDNGIARGPDGNVWFAEPSHVANISPSGTITEYAYPSGERNNMRSGIATGPDGDVWFTEVDEIAAAKIDPTTGEISEYPLKPQHIDCGVSGMAAAGGRLFFGCGTGIVSMTTGGIARLLPTGYQLSDSPLDVALGPDGNAWASALTAVQRARVESPQVATYVPPGAPLTMYAAAAGADGRLWIVCEDGTLYAFTPPRGRSR